MPDGGSIRGEVVLREGEILMRVSDSGPGIAAEDKERLFLPYYSTKGRGTGLGLAIARSIAPARSSSFSTRLARMPKARADSV